jgi:hypothetical protein
MSSVAYWYASKPTKVAQVPDVAKRMPVMRDTSGKWLYSKSNQITSRVIEPNKEMLAAKAEWKQRVKAMTLRERVLLFGMGHLSSMPPRRKKEKD